MLKIDVIKFEAQDVVTTSIPEPACYCGNGCEIEVKNGQQSSTYTVTVHVGHDGKVCSDCKLKNAQP
jgi:hypothetical protein